MRIVKIIGHVDMVIGLVGLESSRITTSFLKSIVSSSTLIQESTMSSVVDRDVLVPFQIWTEFVLSAAHPTADELPNSLHDGVPTV